jgi:sortase A
VAGSVLEQRDLRRFERAREALRSARPASPAAAPAAPATPPPGASTPVDQSQWAEERIRAYQLALAREGPPPLGVLRIPRIGLEVPVLAGTSEWTLDRAVGWIEGTTPPGHTGNVGIAGHRDGFFRGLKDVKLGDALQLETLAGRASYRITGLSIVRPDDVAVLDATPIPSVTLVTCYPFHHVGSAPQRYIVRASLIENR